MTTEIEKALRELTPKVIGRLVASLDGPNGWQVALALAELLATMNDGEAKPKPKAVK
jgi:hypothetical protein